MKRIPNIKGQTINHKGANVLVQDQYVMDGQVVLQTSIGSLRFAKKEAVERIGELLPSNGASKAQANEDDRVAGAYYCTDNLDQFVFHEKNRQVNQAHVSNLVSSIAKKNLLHAQPILVNEKMEVIDGQHRLTAAKEIGRKIYYIIREGLTIEDAISLNINTKNWGYGDYQDYWVSQGVESYIYFKKYRERYRFNYTLAINLIHYGTSVNQWNTKKVFENGQMEVQHRDRAEFVGRLSVLLSPFGNFTNKRSFIRALDLCLERVAFDPWTFLKKVRMAPDKFYKCSDTDSYLRMMEELMNYHNRGERVRLY